MNIILFGPQGSGKGTQSDLIEKKYGLYHLSVGDLLRKEAKKKTILGKKIAEIINSGVLVPDELVNEIIMRVSKSRKAKKGIIFDGYPRTKKQLDFLIKNFDIKAAFEVNIPARECIRRISSRRICSNCGRNYNIIWLKPKVKGKCDYCKSVLKQRDDDKPSQIRKRLLIYKKQTLPLRKYYSKKKILHIIDGTGSINQVFSKIDKILANIAHN